MDDIETSWATPARTPERTINLDGSWPEDSSVEPCCWRTINRAAITGWQQQASHLLDSSERETLAELLDALAWRLAGMPADELTDLAGDTGVTVSEPDRLLAWIGR